jgi:hypothetical protein
MATLAIRLCNSLGSAEGVREWIERWSITEWAVAFGTLALAGFTALLAHRVQGQIALQREEAQARNRPIVYPAVTYEWMRSDQRTRFLLIRNGGLGPALSVEGIVEWQAPQGSPKPQVAVWPSGGLGPGDERLNFLASQIADWHNARGFLLYSGADRRRWRTDFFAQIENKVVVMRVLGTREVFPDDVPSLEN